MDKLVTLESISYSAKKQSHIFGDERQIRIIDDVSFNINKGEILGIVGESGSGKTTLAKIIAGILNNDSGKVTCQFSCNHDKARPVQLLFQNSEYLINPLRRIRDILSDIQSDSIEILKVIGDLGLAPTILDQIGYQVSGGERQRIGLARLLLTNPELLILDEPFAAQDYASKEKIKEIVGNLNTEKKITVVCISHELEMLKNLADRIVVLAAGKIVEISDTTRFFSRPKHPYSKYLIEADEYKLTAKTSTFQENSDIQLCGFFSRCDRGTIQCKIKIEKHEDDYSLTYCNHPYSNSIS